MESKYLYIILLILLVMPVKLMANAWTLETGKKHIEIYNKFYWANKNYDFEGKKIEMGNNGKYKEYKSELKFEYGFNNYTNLLFSLPYKWGKYENDYNTYRNDDIEFLSIGLKYKLLEEDYLKPVVSISLKGEIPGGYNKDEAPSLGHGEPDGEIRLMAGKIFDYQILNQNIKFYNGGGEIGYRIKNKKIPYFGEFGIRLADSILLKGMIDGIMVTYDSDKEPTASELIQKKYEEYSKFIFSISFSPAENFGIAKNTEGITIEFGYGYTFQGKNTAVGSEITLQISYWF